MKLWNKCSENLENKLSQEEFNTWVRPLKANLDKNVLEVLAPNDFILNYVEKNFADDIKLILNKQSKKDISLVFKTLTKETFVDKYKDSKSSNSKLVDKYVFETFVEGKSNHLALAAARQVALNPRGDYNPLFIYGGVGLGKTHLMHAVAHQALNRNPSCRITYVSCEKFTNEFIRAIQENSLTKFRSRYRSVDYLLIDDIQFLAGKERIQEEFFHTFNDIYDSQRQIFLTSDRPAGEIDKIESRLLSRFQWGLVTDIQAPDWETRVAILTCKADAMGISIEPEIIEFLAKSIARNVRRMEGALTRVAGYVGLTRKKADLETVQRLLRDILREENLSRITIETIQKKVVDYYHLRMADMLSRRRPANIAFPRQVAMYLSRILTEHSLQEIGGAFGGRDHGTVIHACKTVENMMDQDDSIKYAVEYLNEELSQTIE